MSAHEQPDRPAAQPPAAEEARPSLPCPLVGVAASAGGLEAFTEMLSALPADPGLALLLVFHLHPQFKSELPGILANATRIPVHEATEGMAVEVNRLYIIPPNKN